MSVRRDSGHSPGPGHCPLLCPDPTSRGQASPVSTPQRGLCCPSWVFEAQPPPQCHRPPCSKQTWSATCHAPEPLPRLPRLHFGSCQGGGGAPCQARRPLPFAPHVNPPLPAPAPASPQPSQPPCPLCSLPPQNSEDIYCWLHCSRLSHMLLGNLASVAELPPPAPPPSSLQTSPREG